MKQIITIIAILFSLSASAQTQPLDSAGRVDSVMKIYSTQTITITIPLKGVILYANYASENMVWERRKDPDVYKPLIGSGTKPDSLINVTISADQLATYVIRLTGERYGLINDIVNSLFHNTPAIAGYTDLFTQVVTKANGAGSEKNAASYVVWKYTKYTDNMTSLSSQMYQKGLNWIRN